MSNLYSRGDVATTRLWLDNEGFEGKFIGWKAEALLGAERWMISKKFQLPEEEEKLDILWSLLTTAKQLRGK